MKIFGYLLLGIFGFVVVGIGGRLLWIALVPVHGVDNTIQTAHDAIDKTINADNAIYNYEWFKQQYEDIEATKRKLDNASIAVDVFYKNAGDRKNWTFEDKNEAARLESIKVSLQNILEQQIADYNARAKMANRNIFQNGIMPSFIDSFTFIKK